MAQIDANSQTPFSDPASQSVQTPASTGMTPAEKAAAVATVHADAPIPETVGHDLALSGYEALNGILGGLPNLIVKRVLPSEEYKKLLAYRAAHPVLAGLGQAAGVVGGLLSGGTEAKLAAAAGKSTIPLIAKVGRVATDAIGSLGPVTGTLARTIPQTAIDYATYGDLPGALQRGATSSLVGVVGGTAAKKYLQKPAEAAAQDLSELPTNYELSRVGMTDSAIDQGIGEGRKVLRASAIAAGEPDPFPVAKGSRSYGARPGDIAVARDPVKDAIRETIRKQGTRGELTFGKLFAEAQPGEDKIAQAARIRAAVLAGNPGIDPQTLEFATQAIIKAGLTTSADIAKAGQTVATLSKKLGAIAKPAAFGAALGAGSAGVSSVSDILQGGTLDPTKIVGGALAGAAGGLALKALPLGIAKVAPAGGAALKLVAEGPGGVGGGVSGAVAAGQPAAAENANLPVLTKAAGIAKAAAAPTATPEDLSNWHDVLIGRASAAYAAARLNGAANLPPFATFYNNYIQKYGGADPLTIARSDTDWLTPEEKKQILRDYSTQKQLKGVDQNYLLRPYSFFDDILGMADMSAEKKKKLYDIDQLYRTLLAPTPGSLVSPQQRATIQHDVDMIRRSGMSTDDKQKAFLRLLTERYGYNPTALKSFGLGE